MMKNYKQNKSMSRVADLSWNARFTGTEQHFIALCIAVQLFVVELPSKYLLADKLCLP